MENTEKFLLDQCARYPELQIQDLLKALHQSTFGNGHLIGDPLAAASWLRQEAQTAPERTPAIEALDGNYCRVHLDYLRQSGLQSETLSALFAHSAQLPAGSEAELERRLSVLKRLADEGKVPFSPEELQAEIDAWRSEGYDARRHSEAFRQAYHPAYRVLHQDCVRYLPLLAAIDRKRAEQQRVLVAIEGGSAGGKSTLGALLTKFYDCNLFHMDDFFLRPEQRTEERFAQVGGNVDWERFSEEVLTPLQRGGSVTYRPFSCRTFTLAEPITVPEKALNIVEGAYSMHPELAGAYDLSVFLKIAPEVQRARILHRNSPEMAETFFARWIPFERNYFEQTDVENRCDLILEVNE